MFKFKFKDKNNIEFLLVCIKLGIGALVYRLAIDLLSYAFLIVVSLGALLFNTNDTVNILMNYGVQMIASVGAFALAAVVTLLLLNIGKHRNFKGPYLRLGGFWLWPCFIVCTIAINFAAAEINALLVNLLSSNLLMSEAAAVTYAEVGALEIVLLIISTAIIPGIVEEIMFRGIILSNLAPYGRGMAIAASAFFFGLMHMNPQQFLYTTVMGVILGLVYVKTRSLWLCIIIHFGNNFLAVIQQIIYCNNSAEVANMYMGIMEIAVALLGALSIVILLIVRALKRRRSPENVGSFGRIYQPSLSYEARPVSRGAKALFFFNPAVLAFIVMVFASMFLTMAVYIILGFIGGFVPTTTPEEVASLIKGFIGR